MHRMLAQRRLGSVKFVALVGSTPSSLPNSIGFEKGSGEKNQWGRQPHVFLVRNKRRLKRLVQINYLSSGMHKVRTKKRVIAWSADQEQYEYGDEHDKLNAISPPPLPTLPVVGQMVCVAKRVWAWMYDNGGRAKVTKVNADGTVDVRYERTNQKREGIALQFISQDTGEEHQFDSGSDISTYLSSDTTPTHERVIVNKMGTGEANACTDRSGSDSSLCDPDSNTGESDSEREWEPHVGNLVFVLTRSWSGMVDEGGHAWVTEINDDDTVDVRYVIDNRKRKNIALKFITPVAGELGTRKRRRPNRYKSATLPKRRNRKESVMQQEMSESLAEERERKWEEKQKKRERWWESWWQRFPWDNHDQKQSQTK